MVFVATASQSLCVMNVCSGIRCAQIYRFNRSIGTTGPSIPTTSSPVSDVSASEVLTKSKSNTVAASLRSSGHFSRVRVSTPFSLFRKENYETVMKRSPEADKANIFHTLKAQWVSLDGAQKEVYKAKVEQQIVQDLMAKHNLLKQIRTNLTLKKKVRRPVVVPRSGAPTGYNVFVKEIYEIAKKESPKGSRATILQMLKTQWTSMIDTEKEVYNSKARSIVEEQTAKRTELEQLRKSTQYPLSAFMLFIKEKRTRLTSLAQLATTWKEMSAKAKQKYVKEAESLRQQFEERKKLLTEEQKNALAELNVERRMKKLKRLGRSNRRKQLREAATMYGRPKKPAPAMGLLLLEMLRSPGRTIQSNIIQDLIARWNSMPAKQKQKYINKARREFVQYRKEMSAWEDKMIASGQKDLVKKFYIRNFRSFLPANVKLPDEQRNMAHKKLLATEKRKKLITRNKAKAVWKNILNLRMQRKTLKVREVAFKRKLVRMEKRSMKYMRRKLRKKLTAMFLAEALGEAEQQSGLETAKESTVIEPN